MGDQREQSPQAFWWRIFPTFNRCENMMTGVLSSEFWKQITDLKQLLGLKETTMVMYIIASKLNSTFGTIGSVTAYKMTAKVVEKLGPFTLAWVKNEIEYLVVQRSTSAKFWTSFCFKIGFFASMWMKTCWYWTSSRISFIWFPVFGNFRF